MEQQLISSLLQGIGTAGLPALLMATAVWYLQKSNRELITQLNTERNERLTTMEKHMDVCDKERGELRSQLSLPWCACPTLPPLASTASQDAHGRTAWIVS